MTASRLAAVALCYASLSLPVEAAEVDFSRDVLPLLKARCAKCHSNGTYKGGMSLDSREALLASKVVVPGSAEKSDLLRRVQSGDADMRMPPQGDPLSPEEVAILKGWIDQGAAWQEGFSFKATSYLARLHSRKPELPAAIEGRTNPIDRFIDAYFAKHQVARPKQVGDELFLRRVCLDIVGLLPDEALLERFLADANPAKRAALVDLLLADQRAYADHWLSFWNDHLRNEYAGTGFIDGGRKQISGWLYRALLENMPYDQFVRELIAPTPDSEGFIRGIQWRGRVNASQTPEIQFAQNVSQVFLGINLKCASCHDSFIDDWKLADAYGLAAIMSDRPLEIHRCDKATGDTASAKFLFPEIGAVDVKAPWAERLKQLAGLMTHAENGRFSRTIVNRIWRRMMGRGIVEPVDVMSNPPWSEDLLDYLAVYLVEHDYDLKQLIRLIATSEAYQAQSTALAQDPTGEAFVFRGPIARRLTAEQFLDAIWEITDTGPNKIQAPVQLPSRDATGPPAIQSSDSARAALVLSDPLMRSLGRPNREQVVTTRPDDLTTLQALDLSNGVVLSDLLDRGAAELLRQHSDWNAEQFTRWLYRSALARMPSSQEAPVAAAIVGQPPTREGLADLMWSLFMLPEFQFVH
jgi:hypothetical protein